jgi:hypothetical protein
LREIQSKNDHPFGELASQGIADGVDHVDHFEERHEAIGAMQRRQLVYK